jgi:hypothetical protein
MTIPTMMNCSHQGEGWCLNCVQVLQEQFSVAVERAEAWEAIALSVRLQCGLVMELLGESQGYLDAHDKREGWKITAEYIALVNDLSHRITVCIDRAYVRTPEILKEELEADDD